MRYVAGVRPPSPTIATAIFFGSGEAYHRAWSNGYPPDTKLTQIGDLFSGFGAIALGLGLYLLGNPVLAATSGLLHAAGKFGSAFSARGKLSFGGRSIDASTLCRIIVLISRAPALIAISADILSSRARYDGSFAFISLVMLVCYLIWSVADLMLLTRDNVLMRGFAQLDLGNCAFSATPPRGRPGKASHASPFAAAFVLGSLRPSRTTCGRTVNPSPAGSRRRAAARRTPIVSGPIRSGRTLAATISCKATATHAA